MNDRATTRQRISFLLENPSYENTLIKEIERIKRAASQQIADIFAELNVLDYAKDRIQSSIPADAKAFNMELRVQKIEKRRNEDLRKRYAELQEYRDVIAAIDLIENSNLKLIMKLLYQKRYPRTRILKEIGITAGLLEGYKEDGLEKLTDIAIKNRLIKSEGDKL